MRIVFCGDWDDGVKKTYKNINYKSFRMGIFVALIALVFIGISVVTSFYDDYIIFLYGTVFLALTILIGFLLLCFPVLVLSNKFMNSLYSYDVIIEDTCISCERKIASQGFYKNIEDVKEVITYDNFYRINFFWTNLTIVCQKDLIAEGTIEEFEEIFKDKIVRKTK